MRHRRRWKSPSRRSSSSGATATWPSSGSSSSAATPRCSRSTPGRTRSRCRRLRAAFSPRARSLHPQRIGPHAADAPAMDAVEHADLGESRAARPGGRHQLDGRPVPERHGSGARRAYRAARRRGPCRGRPHRPLVGRGERVPALARRFDVREKRQLRPRAARVRVQPDDPPRARRGQRHPGEDESDGDAADARHAPPGIARAREPAEGWQKIAAHRRWASMRTALALTLLVASAAVVDAALLQPGDRFPSWTLPDQTGARVSSTDLAGKTYLLWFYPRAMTPGCTAEGRSLRDQIDAFRTRGVDIVGVSFDDPARNAEFVKAEGFPFRLLSDETHVLAMSVGATDSPASSVARRISYLVGPDGTVRQVYASVNPASHAKDVLGDLASP